MEDTKTIHLGEKEQETKGIKLQKLEKAQIIVTLSSIVLGTVLHFLYKWTGENIILASFSAVNESVWEHLKLVFYPMLILGIVEYFFVKDITNNYIEAKTIGIFFSICFIVISFFTYTGILGTNFLFLDILIFILSILLGEYLSYKFMKRQNESNKNTKILASTIIIFLLLCFITFTYTTPEVNLFRDPITGIYGIE